MVLIKKIISSFAYIFKYHSKILRYSILSFRHIIILSRTSYFFFILAQRLGRYVFYIPHVFRNSEFFCSVRVFLKTAVPTFVFFNTMLRSCRIFFQSFQEEHTKIDSQDRVLCFLVNKNKYCLRWCTVMLCVSTLDITFSY